MILDEILELEIGSALRKGKGFLLFVDGSGDSEGRASHIQKRLKAANWDEFSKGTEFIEKILTSRLQKGVSANLTPDRV